MVIDVLKVTSGFKGISYQQAPGTEGLELLLGGQALFSEGFAVVPMFHGRNFWFEEIGPS